MPLTPLYVLEKIKECIRKRESRPYSISFPAASKSIDAVAHVFGKRNKYLSRDEAKDYILEKILTIKPGDFCEYGKFGALDADVYGKAFDGEVWYIKIVYDDGTDTLKEISFHPADRDLILQSGKNIGKGRCRTWKN